MVVDGGHKLVEKGEEARRLKTNSYVLETKDHSPADHNLLLKSFVMQTVQ